jgi:glycosyltransferase involved in cell wall biosynthesis
MLFISSYLSRQSGSMCVSEKIAEHLNKDGFNIELVSRKKNKLLRISNIILRLLITKSKVLHLDVYSGQAFMITEIASLIGSFLNKKMIFTLHGGILPDFYTIHPERVNKVFRRASRITTPSKMLKAFFEPKGFKIDLIPNAIDFQYFQYKRESIAKHSILWVRAFDPIYNPKLAIEIFNKVLLSFPDARLTMVGPDKGELADSQRLINELGIENKVEITGPIPNTELQKYYHTHEVYINTTSYESFGVSVMEAAACGIPIITTPVGELPLIWNDSEVIFTEGVNASGFVSSIIRLFNHSELALSLSKNAHLKSLSYDWKKIRPEWINIFNTVK